MKKLSKEDLKNMFINAKWADPYGSFADSEFVERINIYIPFALSDAGLKAEYKEYFKDSKNLSINNLIAKYFDVDVKYIGEIFIEAEEEFEKEFYEKD